MSAELLKGRYTGTDRLSDNLVGAVRYLNPQTGELYEDADSKIYANSGFRPLGCGKWANGTWEFVMDAASTSWPPKRIKGRYTRCPGGPGSVYDGYVCYIDPATGYIYDKEEGGTLKNRLKPGTRIGVWVGIGRDWEFTSDEVAVEPAKPILGFCISSSKGAPTVLQRTREIAEAEALRLAQGNTGVEFTVFPVYCGKAVAKAHTPKPVAKLEKLQ